MEQQRVLLLFGLALVVFLIWDAWQRDHTLPPTAGGEIVNIKPSTAGLDEIPESTEDKAQPSLKPAGPTRQVAPTFAQRQRVNVTTDVYKLQLDSQGGDLRVVDLLKYPETSDNPEIKFRLMNDTGGNLFIAQSGFTRPKTGSNLASNVPNHLTVYQVQQTEYNMANDANELVVPFMWVNSAGVQFIKEYVFRPNSYVIELRHRIINPTAQTVSSKLYYQLRRRYSSDDSLLMLPTYAGGVIYSEEDKYEKISFDDMEDSNLNRSITGGWAAMIQHYFLGAIIPPEKAAQKYFTSYSGEKETYTLGLKDIDAIEALPGTQAASTVKLFVGPKLQSELEKTATGLELTVDYGWTTIFAEPLFWLLDLFHGWTGNWGWAILLLTLVVKLAFYKLSEASYKSMAKMRTVHPRMVALKERYSNDKQALNRAMMDMYKKEKINPLGGCWPILIQIPVFIALYYVLLESVELRQAPWILWITDMSIKDPFFILPVLMGVTMYIQQKLNPAPLDPIQAKIFMFLPIVFTALFITFPAGLVLYWVANNILSIAQQWYITRIVMKDMPANKAAAKKK